jgi:hypothetical protein
LQASFPDDYRVIFMTSCRLATSCHFCAQAAFGPTPPCSQERRDCPASIGGSRFLCTAQPGPIAEIGNCYGPSPLLPFDGFHNLKIYAAIFHISDTNENRGAFR